MALVSFPDVPEWQDAAAYSMLFDLERAGFAWEWLRRQIEFREAAISATARSSASGRTEDNNALAWHLHVFEDPRLAAPAARPVWTASGHPWVIGAVADRSSLDEDSFDLAQFARFAKVVDSSASQRLLLSDGYRSIRLDVIGARLESSPVRLSFGLAGLRELERPLLVLRRLRSLALGRRFAPTLHPQVRRARRHVLLLRTLDALHAGASQADVAAVLLSSNLNRRRWRIHSPSVRLQAQRMVQAAKRMADGEFWRLLK